MKQTPNLLLKLPEPTDYVLVEDLNENFVKIDIEIAKITDEETGVEAKLKRHADDKDNPHTVTKDQVGLGNVQNYDVATQVEAETGSSSAKYMTPERTKQAIDKGLVTLNEAFSQHLDESASEAHGAVRKEYILFQGALTSGTVNLTLPSGFTNLNDFDEVIISGTMDTTSSATWKHFSQRIDIKNVSDFFGFSETHEILFTTASSNVFWLRGTLNKIGNSLSISYNRRKLGAAIGEDVTVNAVGGVVGVKYD